MKGILLWCLFLFPLTVPAQFYGDAELGGAFNTKNDIWSPNDARGTPFNLPAQLQGEATFYYRLRLGYMLKEKHSFSLLYAPLTLYYEGSFNRNIVFQDVLFTQADLIRATYHFHSYRLTYRYELVRRENFELGIGLTGNIRDVQLRLRAIPGGETNTAATHFLPLLNFRVFYKPTNKIYVLLKGDILPVSRNRTQDVFAGLLYPISPNIHLKLGYRVTEGRTENGFYNFVINHYLAAGITGNL